MIEFGGRLAKVDDVILVDNRGINLGYHKNFVAFFLGKIENVNTHSWYVDKSGE